LIAECLPRLGEKQRKRRCARAEQKRRITQIFIRIGAIREVEVVFKMSPEQFEKALWEKLDRLNELDSDDIIRHHIRGSFPLRVRYLREEVLGLAKMIGKTKNKTTSINLDLGEYEALFSEEVV
jgi:hypothetical protein